MYSTWLYSSLLIDFTNGCFFYKITVLLEGYIWLVDDKFVTGWYFTTIIYYYYHYYLLICFAYKVSTVKLIKPILILYNNSFSSHFYWRGGNFLEKGVFKTGEATLGYCSSIYFILIYSLSEKILISHIPV